MDCELKVLFLDASNRTLINRYKELRRPHPVNPNGALSDSIELEREMLSEIKDNSDIIIDTTRLSASSFKNKLNTLFFNGNKKDLVINIESFGFKNGILVEAGYINHEEEQADRIGKILYQVLVDNDFSWLKNRKQAIQHLDWQK